MIARALIFAVAAVSSGCTANAVCAQRQECNDKLEPDSQAVCVENYNAFISSLRANTEDECLAWADAQLAFDACLTQLDCNDLEDAADVEDACGDEQDDLSDAIAETDGECSSLE
jgi:hypothetical protein